MTVSDTGSDARTRQGPGPLPLVLMLLPALTVVVVLFGGGLLLGVLQALGHLPGAGLRQLTGAHFSRILTDPDFFLSFGLTLYVSIVSTLLAAGFSVVAALALNRMARRYRLVHFVIQIPLTVPPPGGIATGIVIALVVMLAVVLAQMLTKAARKRGVIL
jgi:putative spermidine/putrescine transport system permease protein